jgi:predicted lactoylglutathione lyase
MKSLTPLLHVQDMAESLAFYQVLGFEIEQCIPEDGTPTWAYLVHGGVHMMLQESPEVQPEHRLSRAIHEQMVLHIGHADLVGLHALLVQSKMPVSELSGAEASEFMVRDPDGYTLILFLDEA